MVLDVFASVAAGPADPAMPSAPPGTLTVTVVSARKPVAGVNVAVSPDTCQLPLIDGESVGSRVCGDSAAENVTVIGEAPLAS